MPEEPQLNGRIASIISRITTTSEWNVREELRGALRGPKTKPDILISRQDGPPVVIEVEYLPAATLAEDCMKSIGRPLDPTVANAAGTVNTVIAVQADKSLKDAETGDLAQQMLEQGHTINYAVYQGTSEEDAYRFPERGFIEGNIKDLVDFIRPATQAQDLIDAATLAFEQGVQDTAAMILNLTRNSTAGQHMGTELRQPWPAVPANPPTTDEEIEQEKTDQIAREQTAKMTAAMLINALAYQQHLAGYEATVEIEGREEVRTIKSLGQIRKPTGFHPDDIIAEWENILSINYWAIFQIAKKLLKMIPPGGAEPLTERMVKTANEIQTAIRQSDVAGTVFQRLIADRQTLATYYTRPESTTLAAYLAIPDDLDWADPETVKDYQISDYACGTGGLILAAYQRIRDLHRNNGGNPDDLHTHMIENNLTACDIMPAAVHLTSSLLSSVAPRNRYKGSRQVLYPYGATYVVNNQGDPIIETNSKGKPRQYQNGDPVYRMNTEIGSLELLNITTTKFQAVLPLTQDIALGGTIQRSAVEIEMTSLTQDLVIMNPPFTTPTNHAADHAKPGNPAFAAFGTSKDEQNAMAARVNSLSANTIGDGYAGLGSNFAAIAHNMVRPGGQIALILPISSMLGGSDDGNRAISWQKFRRLLATRYSDIIVVSIAHNEDLKASFSADTNMAEVIVIARSTNHGEEANGLIHFVNLREKPSNKLSAMEIAKTIKRAASKIQELNVPMTITVGETPVGEIQREAAQPRGKWKNCRILNSAPFNAAIELENGFLRLPRNPHPIGIPITQLGKIGEAGPVHRSFNSAFSRTKGATNATEWPMLWNRNENQNTMLVTPDSSGAIKSNQKEKAQQLWKRTSNLHISAECRFNSNPTCANFTPQRTAGGRSWPNLQLDTEEMEKATCAWLNTTLGFIGYWIESNRSQGGRGGTTVTALRQIPTLDLKALASEKVTRAAEIFDSISGKIMLPANEAYRDEVRQELDRRILTEVLDLDETILEQLDTLRYQWCTEPTVVGVKDTGPDSGHLHNMKTHS